MASSHTFDSSSSSTSASAYQSGCIHDHDVKNGHNHDNDSAWEESSNHAFCLPKLPPPQPTNPSTSLISTNVESESDTEKTHTPLHLGWNYYYHLPNDKNWNVDSYKIIMSNISTLEELMGMNELMTDNIIKNCMLFVMRVGVTPMWEDAQNRQGGCFSYKVTNKAVTQVWRKLMYLLCGYTLTTDPTHMDLVNGITISPKRGFCIIKIWMRDCSLQDPAVITNIDQLLRNGCLFKAHNPEF